MNLTNLEKIYWEEDKISKGELIEYYAKIAPFILPHLKNRPIVLHRFPEGIAKEAFYQKEIGKDTPPFVKTVSIAHTEKKISYLLIQNAKSLLYAINLGSIELHPFLSVAKHIDAPDFLVFDLDPENISFFRVLETALVLHEILEEAKAPNFCKTSGGSGLHIYVPLKGKYSYEQARQFAFLIATLAQERLPGITSLERMPKKRQKKVYIDTLQNVKGQTVVAPYSVRGMPHAPVSTPVDWKEVNQGFEPEDFTLRTVPKRISRKKDLFQGVLGTGADLLKCLERLGLH